ncbi:MAG: hypothetical protein U5J78_05865 [Parasphingorhabdus sp.]|nr:hypothetical protein [Parasphingorhabdus sp.]
MIAEWNDWLMGLGMAYGVNPYIFAAIYIGAIPFFFGSLAWLYRARKAGRSITLPIVAAGLCLVSSYIYLGLVGHNIPYWVWGFLAVLLAYGTWSTIRSIRSKILEADSQRKEA